MPASLCARLAVVHLAGSYEAAGYVGCRMDELPDM